MAQNKDKSSSSFFHSIASTVPIAVGAGLAYKGFKQAGGFGNILSSNSPAVTVQAAPVAEFRKLVIDQATKASQLPNINQVLRLQDLSDIKYNTLGEEIPLRSSQEQLIDMWSQAATKSGVPDPVVMSISSRLKSAPSNRATIADLSLAVAENNSVHVQRATSLFLKNLSTIERRGSQTTKTGFVDLEIGESYFESNSFVQRKNISFGKIQDPIIESYLQKMQRELDAEIKLTSTSRTDIPGSELWAEFRGGKLGKHKLQLRIPRVLKDNPNIVVRGGTQQSKYITGTFGLVENNVLKQTYLSDQWTAFRAYEDLVFAISKSQRITRGRIRQLQNAFDRRTLKDFEWVESITPGTHQGVDKYISSRSNVMHLYATGKASFADGEFTIPEINEFDYSKMLKGQYLAGPEGPIPIYPGHSPGQIAKNVVSLTDARQASLFPEAFPWAKRPMQGMRKQATPTPEALRRMNQISLMQKRFGWAELGVGIDSPILKAAYVSDRFASELSEAGMGTQGGLLVSKNAAAERAVGVLQQFDISPDQIGEEFAPFVSSSKGQGNWNINLPFEKGTILGVSPTGEVVSLPENMNIIQATAFKDEGKGIFMRVMGMKEADLSKSWSKVFLGAKGMAAPTSQEYIDEVLSRFNYRDASEAIISMGELKKNRALHYHQMFTSLWDFTEQNMSTGQSFSKLATNFAGNPKEIISKLRRLSTQGNKLNHDRLLSSAFSIARGAQLNPEQIGSVFGAVPDVFGFKNLDSPEAFQEEWLRYMMGTKGKDKSFIDSALSDPSKRGTWQRRFGLSVPEASSILRGVAGGATQLMFEGLGGPGAGATGTMEPRLFETFGMSHWGDLGKDIQKDLLSRMTMSNPQALYEQEVLTRSVESMLNPKGLEGSILPSAVNEERLAAGFNLRLPGIGDVNIPGTSQVSSLASYKTAAGETITSDLGYQLDDFLENSVAYEQGSVAEDQMRAQLAGLSSNMQSARIGAGNKLVRGSVPGSVFLTGVPSAQMRAKEFASRIEDFGVGKFEELAPYEKYLEKYVNQDLLLDSGEVGITAPYAAKAFKELEKVSSNPELIREQAEKFFLSGSGEGGLLWRHPVIGPYSAQAVRYRLMPGSDPIIMFNEAEKRAVFKAGKLGEGEAMSLQFETNRITQKGAKQQLIQQGFDTVDSLRFSAMPGMAGDTDADIYSFAVVEPDLEKKLSKNLTFVQDDYTVHSIRSQLMQSKAKSKGLISFADAMADDAMKLRITKGGRLGKLSVTLQAAKAGTMAAQKQLGREAALEAFSLAEWLEQTPISAKHIAEGKTPLVIDQLQEIQKAFRQKDSGQLQKTIGKILQFEEGSARKGLIGEGITLATEGGKAPIFIPGINVPRAASNLIGSLKSFEESKAGGVSARRIRELLFERATPSVEESKALMTEAGLNLSPLGSTLHPTRIAENTGTISKMTSRLMSLKNRAVKAGGKLLPLAKPLGLGFAASVALSTILSAPSLSVDPGSMAPPTPNMRSGSGGANISNNLHPDSPSASLPAPPPSLPAGRAYATSGGSSVNIRGRSQGGTNYGNVNRQIGSTMGRGNIRITSNVSDDRSSLDSQRIGHIIKNR